MLALIVCTNVNYSFGLYNTTHCANLSYKHFLFTFYDDKRAGKNNDPIMR
jgi:hypothetical protein